MIRLEELKRKNYNPEYAELYEFIFGVDIDSITDDSAKESDKESYKKNHSLDITIRHRNMNDEILLRKFDDKFLLYVRTIKGEKIENYIYEKIESYMFESLSDLVSKLRELLKKLAKIVVIEYDKRPYKKIYDLLTYADMETIGDDSSWLDSRFPEDLSLVLADSNLNKIIFVSHSKLNYNRYEIIYNELDSDTKDKSYDECFIKQTCKDEDDMYNKLKEMIGPCLKDKRVRDIGHRYNTTYRELFMD